jgi:hypothetical protein
MGEQTFCGRRGIYEHPRISKFPETTNLGARRYCLKGLLGKSLNTTSRLSCAPLSKIPSPPPRKGSKKGTNCLYDSSIATISEGVRPRIPSMIERSSQDGPVQDLCRFFEKLARDLETTKMENVLRDEA